MNSPVNKNNIIIYESDEGKIKINVFFENEDFWLTQKIMADLFDVQKATISKHLKNIFDSGELQKDSTVSKKETVENDGDRTVHRRLNIII